MLKSAAGAVDTASLEAALAEARRQAAPIAHASAHHARLCALLQELGRRQEALAVLEEVQRLPTGTPQEAEALAFACFSLGEHALARHHYALVAKMASHDALAWYNLASAERNIGNLDAAEAACERALNLDRGLAQAALLRSQLRTQRVDRNHIDNLKARINDASAVPGVLIFLHYAIGKEFDDLGEFEQAFHHYSQGAHIRRAHLNYDVALDIAKFERIRQVYPLTRGTGPASFERASDYGFIIGLPRSGTTLLERVLTGSALVQSNGETENLLGALMEGLGTGGDIFERAANADASAVAAAYARRAGPVRTARGLILEKLPLNYLYAGAIAHAMPRAPIIAVERHPVASCFGMFTTLFGNAYPFSYALSDLARYYVAYRNLLGHWQQRLGAQLLVLRYEDFVAAPGALGARAAAHAGIPWEAAMVRIENNRSASATASAVQIRKPIYTSAVDRWRNYGDHLAPLIDLLDKAGIDCA